MVVLADAWAVIAIIRSSHNVPFQQALTTVVLVAHSANPVITTPKTSVMVRIPYIILFYPPCACLQAFLLLLRMSKCRWWAVVCYGIVAGTPSFIAVPDSRICQELFPFPTFHISHIQLYSMYVSAQSYCNHSNNTNSDVNLIVIVFRLFSERNVLLFFCCLA